MLSRALSLATVMLLIGCFAAERTLAQENLDAGKTPSQLFAGTCNACHKSPRGLLKTVPASSLSGFLRQHYTTSPSMAGVLASYLVSNGATDTRLPKEGSKEARQDAKSASDQPERAGRKQAKQEPRTEPSARPDEGEAPPQAAIDHGPDGRKLTAKQKLSKRGKPGAEEPKVDAKVDASPSGDMPKEEAKPEGAKPEVAKPEGAKPEVAKPAEARPAEPPSQSAKVEPSSDGGVMRPDPVPPVTPAPAAAAATAAPTPPPQTPPALSAAAVSAAVAGTTTEVPAVPLPSAPAPVPPPAVTAAAPALPPVAPAGPPAPPISQ
jgi:hypothetical protein